MDNHLTIRLPKRLVKATLVLALVAAVISPIAVSASHTFDDVPDTNLFHEDITWMADAGVTAGCNPPANDNYCPNDNVTRAQMAAFMRRLAENQVVDAATALTADSAATAAKADNATTADDANLLDGANSATYRSRAAASDVNLVSISPASTTIATITGFTVPASGGLLIAEGNAAFLGGTGPDLGIIWIEFDNGGLCDSVLPVSSSFWQTATGPLSENISTQRTLAASAADHRIDLCAVSAAETLDTFTGSLSVQWVEHSEGSSTSSSGGVDISKQLAEATLDW